MSDQDQDPFADYEPASFPTLEEDRPPRPRDRRRESTPDMFLNGLALLFVALAIAVCLFALLLMRDPNLPFNPFPPATATETAVPAAPAATAGPTILVVTATPPDGAPTDRPAPTETATPRPTATRAAAPPDATNTPSSYPFTLQNDAPTYTEYTGEAGCDYMAIAGQVFDVDGQPLVGMPILVEGDDLFSALGFTGNAPTYGPSGYEVFINDLPYEGTFTVRLIGENGQPRSADVVVETSDSCERNLVIVNFVANQPLD